MSKTRRKSLVIGRMSAWEAADKLAAMGDNKTAAAIRRLTKQQGNQVRFAAIKWPWKKDDPIYKYTDHAFGFIPKGHQPGATTVDIQDAGSIQADTTLKGSNVRITLDRLRVFDYPGSGIHTVLFDFYAQHQTSDARETQDLHFAQKYRVRQGSGAGITGYPVFVGLRVGSEGVSFKCHTINVTNEDDQKVLSFLDGDVFKKGLTLLNSINPVVPVVSSLATGIISAFEHRHDNVQVQDFYMGLDFSGVQTRAQLREGSYVAVQVPEASAWDWLQWIFKPANGQIVSRQAPNQTIRLNYVVFSVSKIQ